MTKASYHLSLLYLGIKLKMIAFLSNYFMKHVWQSKNSIIYVLKHFSTFTVIILATPKTIL